MRLRRPSQRIQRHRHLLKQGTDLVPFGACSQADLDASKIVKNKGSDERVCYDSAAHYKKEYYTDAECKTALTAHTDYVNGWFDRASFDYMGVGCISN